AQHQDAIAAFNGLLELFVAVHRLARSLGSCRISGIRDESKRPSQTLQESSSGGVLHGPRNLRQRLCMTLGPMARGAGGIREARETIQGAVLNATRGRAT